MAEFYGDENVSGNLIPAIRSLGHDLLRAVDDGRQSFGDPLIFARAIQLGRCVLTNNRKDFRKLHRANPAHAGILIYTHDEDFVALAARIDAAVRELPSLHGRLIRIVKPNPPA